MQDISSFLKISSNIPITLIESFLILFFSSISGIVIRYFFLRFGDSMSSKIGFGNSILISTISVAGLIAIVKSSLALSLGLVGALSVIRFRTAVKEPYNLAFILFSFCVAIAIGASYFRFAFFLLITGCLTIYFLNKKSRKNFSEDSLGGLDNISVELPADANLKDIYCIFEKYLSTFFVKAISEKKDGTICLTIKASIHDIYSLEGIRKDIRNKYSDNSFAFYGTSS